METIYKLPKEVTHKGKKYSLFVYPDFSGWCVEYAMGRFFCDAENGCADDDYYNLHGVSDKDIEKAARKMAVWLNGIRGS